MTRGVSELLSCSLRSKHARNSEREEEDGAALTARESACEERNRLKVSLLTRVLFSSVYYLSRVCVTRRFLRTYDRSRRNRSDETRGRGGLQHETDGDARRKF